MATAEELLEITAPVSQHLAELTKFMKGQAKEFEPEVQELVRYALKSSGKRLRPILVFYGGWRDGAKVDPHLVKAAAVIEFVHLATLVHDDILDKAVLRHSFPTVAKRYGEDVAVLVGDAIFSHALKLAAEFPTVDVCRGVSLATRRVCAGEIAQTFHRGDVISMESYFYVINGKTAELFYISSYLGAKLAGYSEAFSEASGTFGRHLGIAYQIFDDMADFFGEEKRIGKSLGTDLDTGKFTLPLILLLEQLGEDAADKMVEDIRAGKMTLAALQPHFEKYHIAEAVKGFFLRELDAAESALAPYMKLEPSKHLIKLTRYVRSSLVKLDMSPEPSKL